jgi:hypothetical protein
MASRSRTTHLDRWRKSGTFRRIASDSARANLKTFEAAPRCNAKRKRDGQPCEKPAMTGKQRCRNHGGATPSGSAWHVPQYADPSTPRGERKLLRKLGAMQRYAEKRAARLAAMSDTERERYLAWCRMHPAGGSKAARRAKIDRARQDSAMRQFLSQKPSEAVLGPELALVQMALAAAREQLARLEAKAREPIDVNEGIFS